MPDDDAPRTFTLGATRPAPESGRRAAPPKSQRPMASKGDVDKAVAMLDTLYALIGDGMDLFGLEETQEKWETAVTKLRRTNKDSLSASPKLAKSIANIGEGGGAATFFLAHVFAVATLYPVARREMQENLAARPARHAAENPENQPYDWDAAAAQMPAEYPGGYNVGEHIPGL